MKTSVEKALQSALLHLRSTGIIKAGTELPVPQVTRAKDPDHGDFATNLALVLAKSCGYPPRELAEKIVAAITDQAEIRQIKIAGPGFINFFIDKSATNTIIRQIIEQGTAFGENRFGADQKVLIEFVSANPTGPLHVGHGRGAAYGEALADILSACGFAVTREYYVNDAGRQMDILAVSIWLRYLQTVHKSLPFPSNGYQGDYVTDIASNLYRQYPDRLLKEPEEVLSDLPKDAPDGGDKEAYIDAIITRCKSLLADDYALAFNAGLQAILEDIRDDLLEFGIEYQSWFSERSLTDTGKIAACLETLREAGHLYEKEGALWFASSTLGDEKDRVVMRENGQHTYFASDIAYHLDKIQRGYDRIINVWGADHHGYIPRVNAALRALTGSSDKLEVLLVQFATLYRGREKIQMSTRSGSYVSLRELRNEVSNDAARFFYIMRRSEQHMDFDLELAKSQTNENPVYYIQYAHARIASVFRQLAENKLEFSVDTGLENLHMLTTEHEQNLIRTLSRYADVLESAGRQQEPHQLSYFLRELANDFHSYYNAHQFLVENAELRNARLALIAASRQILKNALTLIGLSAPEKM